LWVSKTTNNKSLGQLAEKGNQLYKSILTVIRLNVVRRQTGQFRDFLQRNRDGKNTEEDWTYLNKNCAFENFTSEKKQSFMSNETIFLYNTNEECEKKNNDQLLNLRQPICCIEAEHDSENTKQKSSEFCRKLQKKLFLAYGAKLMLLWNISLKHGLVNGSIGIVEDFIYSTGKKAPALPYALVVNFPEYNGPPFFEGNGREHWVPLRTQKYQFDDMEGSHYREQFPISLCWGLTTWKAQGVTVKKGTKLFVDLGDKERTTGVTYVGLSRNEDIEDLCIGNAITLERLTSKLQSKALAIRLLEDERLSRLCEQTKRYYNLMENANVER